MSKVLAKGDNHPGKVYLGVYVKESVAKKLKAKAKAQDRSLGSLLRQILSSGDNHPSSK